jgi:hypothetical protein
VKEETKILIKNSKQEVFEFLLQHLDESGNIEGQVLKPKFRDLDTVTALFKIDSDRYFLTTRLKRKDGKWILLSSTHLYKFNRRSAFRVMVPLSLELIFLVQSIRNIEVNRKVKVLEFSSSGARVHWFNDKGVSKGTLIKGVLQWGRGKILPIEASLVHNSGEGICGLKFVNLNGVVQNRLKMLSIEIQQTIHFQDL